MTWKRVATAVVLIPFVVGIVLWGSTAILALAVGLVTMLALFEYFALGEAIGHRAYRFWTATCALLLIYVQWLMGDIPTYKLSGGLVAYQRSWYFARGVPSLEAVFFFFVLGIAAVTLFTKRPLVEALPAAGIKDSGSILPGHGGVLDRIDALTLAIPVVWYYWVLIYSPKS